MKKRKKTYNASIAGYIIASDWDENDNIVEISLQAEIDDYFIVQNRFGKELIEQVDKKVEIRGVVTEDRDGTKWLKVSKYEILSDYDEEENIDNFDDPDSDDTFA